MPNLSFRTLTVLTQSTPGTPVGLTVAPTLAKTVILTADPGNADTMFILESGFAKTDGIPLTAGNSLQFDVGDDFAANDRELIDLSQIFVDTDGGGGTKLRINYIGF